MRLARRGRRGARRWAGPGPSSAAGRGRAPSRRTPGSPRRRPSSPRTATPRRPPRAGRRRRTRACRAGRSRRQYGPSPSGAPVLRSVRSRKICEAPGERQWWTLWSSPYATAPPCFIAKSPFFFCADEDRLVSVRRGRGGAPRRRSGHPPISPNLRPSAHVREKSARELGAGGSALWSGIALVSAPSTAAAVCRRSITDWREGPAGHSPPAGEGLGSVTSRSDGRPVPPAGGALCTGHWE